MTVLSIIMGVLLMMGGFYFLFTPGITFLSMWMIVGILLVIEGITEIGRFGVRKKTGKSSALDLVTGIMALVLGLVVLFNRFASVIVDVVLIYIFAVWIIVRGGMQIGGSMTLKKLGLSSWVWVLIAGILSIVIGIYGLFHPRLMAIAIGWLFGFIIIMEGINLITMAGVMDRADK